MNRRVTANARRTLGFACLSHALHDGYTDVIYVLLPLWQSEFGLGFGALAHPVASAAVSRVYGASARGPLGTYNFAGDLGKALLPALVSLLLVMVSWRRAVELIAVLGAILAMGIAAFMPRLPRLEAATAQEPQGD